MIVNSFFSGCRSSYPESKVLHALQLQLDLLKNNLGKSLIIRTRQYDISNLSEVNDLVSDANGKSLDKIFSSIDRKVLVFHVVLLGKRSV